MTCTTEIRSVLRRARKAQVIAVAATARQRATAVLYLHRLQSRYLGLTAGRADRLRGSDEASLHDGYRAARAELPTCDRACFVQGWREAYYA